MSPLEEIARPAGLSRPAAKDVVFPARSILTRVPELQLVITTAPVASIPIPTGDASPVASVRLFLHVLVAATTGKLSASGAPAASFKR